MLEVPCLPGLHSQTQRLGLGWGGSWVAGPGIKILMSIQALRTSLMQAWRGRRLSRRNSGPHRFEVANLANLLCQSNRPALHGWLPFLRRKGWGCIFMDYG